MKKIIFFILTIVTLHTVKANKPTDIIYLKNGSIIYGTIKEQGEKIKIQINGGSLMVYKTDEVDSIKQEPLNKTLRRDFFTIYYRKNKGYRNITEVQFSYGTLPGTNYFNLLNGGIVYPYYGGNTDDIALSFHTINGYQVCPQFFIGAGVGVDRLFTFRETYIPLYLRLQSELLKKRITPYIFADGGYAFFVADQIRNTEGYSYYNRIGGAYMTFGGGIHIYTKGPISYMIGAGYRRNYAEIKYGTTSGQVLYPYQDKFMFQRFIVTCGLSF